MDASLLKLLDICHEQQLWSKTIQLKRNQILKSAGSIDQNMYWIVEGSLRIFIQEGLEEHTIRFGYQNNLITALDSFITGESSDLVIQSLKKTTLKVIPKSKLQEAIETSEELKIFWTRLLEQMLVQQLEREKDLLLASPAERFKRVHQRSPQLFQEIPLKYIANYLRMTPETLSRIKKS